MKRKVILGVILIVICLIFNVNICHAESENIDMTGNIDSEKNIAFNIQASGITGFNGIISFEKESLDYIGYEEKNGCSINIDENELTISGIVSTNNSEKEDIVVLKFKAKNTEDNTTEGVYITDLKILKTDGNIEENLKIGDTIDIINHQEEQNQSTDDHNIQMTDGTASDENGNIISESTLIDQSNIVLDYGGDDQELSNNSFSLTDSIEEGNTVNMEEYEDSFTESDENAAEGEMVLGNEVLNEEDELVDESDNQVSSKSDKLVNGKIPQTGLIVTIVPITIAVILLIIGSIAYKKSKGN